MTNMNMIHAIGSIDMQLILDAAPDKLQKKKAQIIWIKGAFAACFCLLIVGIIRLSFAFMPNQMTDPYREGILMEITNIDELPAKYDGILLAENLDFEKAEFYYDINGAADNVEDWNSLLISKSSKECIMTMYCMFGAAIDDWKVDRVFTRDATEIIHLNGVDIQIARQEPSLQFKYLYYAIFEYDGVVYDIRVASDDENSIYTVLNMVLK